MNDHRIAKKVMRFLRDDSGPAAVEYAIMLAFILLAALSSITLLGQSSMTVFRDTGTRMPGR